MKKRRLMAAVLAAGMLISMAGCGGPTAKTVSDIQPVAIEKSEYSNPIIKFRDEYGDPIYGGDPAVYVDGDTVYLYTGHDMSTDKEVSERIYHIPEYLCYSSTDLINWKQEGVVMDMQDVEWARNSTSAWASQVIKHHDPEQDKDLYYLYFCSWDKTARGKQSIGVAVSESPTGPFVDKGEPIVNGLITKPESSAFNDIDPTVWVETGDDGEEHRYLMWGNGILYGCELNEDMTSVKDLNGDGEITYGIKPGTADIYSRTNGLVSYTEAPWIYRRQDENGEYYGDYYLFFAYTWRENMAYAVTDDLLFGEWRDEGVFMPPTATCNTNHEAIFDFKGKTYMMYHNGAQPGGNGYRRSACLQELTFGEDGTVKKVTESTKGLAGTSSTISLSTGEKIEHEPFVCSNDDADYPYVDIALGSGLSEDAKDSSWVIISGKSDEADENLVSIEAENKVGMFITATEDGTLVLSQDVDGKEPTALAQTFKTYEGLSGVEGEVTLESVSMPGYFLSLSNGVLTLTDAPEAATSSFAIIAE